MKILVTGSSGFVAKHLINRLVDEGHFVYALQRSAASNIAENVHVIAADLSKDDFIQQLSSDIDVVYHLAQSKQYRSFPDGANDMFNVNIKSTQLLLEWSRLNGVKKFFYASTGNVYEPSNKILSIDDKLNANSYYAASKLSAEQLVKQYAIFFEVFIGRIFTVFGKGQENMLIPNIINSVKERKEITLNGGDGLWMTPIHVDNICDLLIGFLINKNIENSLITNISGVEKVSLKQVVQKIAQTLSIELNIIENEGVAGSLCGLNYNPFNLNIQYKSILDTSHYI